MLAALLLLVVAFVVVAVGYVNRHRCMAELRPCPFCGAAPIECQPMGPPHDLEARIAQGEADSAAGRVYSTAEARVLLARIDAALDLLALVDLHWREGKEPPIERIRTLLLAAGRSLEVGR